MQEKTHQHKDRVKGRAKEGGALLDEKYILRVSHNHGWEFSVEDKTLDFPESILFFFKYPTKGTDFRKVFHPKNVLRYYLWSCHNKLFWKCFARRTKHRFLWRIADFLRGHNHNVPPPYGIDI
jgi:hypothetical protein